MSWPCLGLVAGWVMQLASEDLLLSVKSSLSFSPAADSLLGLTEHYLMDSRRPRCPNWKLHWRGMCKCLWYRRPTPSPWIPVARSQIPLISTSVPLLGSLLTVWAQISPVQVSHLRTSGNKMCLRVPDRIYSGIGDIWRKDVKQHLCRIWPMLKSLTPRLSALLGLGEVCFCKHQWAIYHPGPLVPRGSEEKSYF